MANWRNPIGRSTQEFLTTYSLSSSTDPSPADPAQLAPAPLSRTGSESIASPSRILDPRDYIRSSAPTSSLQTKETQATDLTSDPTQAPQTSVDGSSLDRLNTGSELDLEAAQPRTLAGSSLDLSRDPLQSDSLESLASESLATEVTLVPDLLPTVSGTSLWQDPAFQSGITAGILLLVAIGLFWLNTWIERYQLDQPTPFSSQMPSRLATAEDWDES